MTRKKKDGLWALYKDPKVKAALRKARKDPFRVMSEEELALIEPFIEAQVARMLAELRAQSPLPRGGYVPTGRGLSFRMA